MNSSVSLKNLAESAAPSLAHGGTQSQPAWIRQFHDEGYVIVPDVFDPADLEPLRRELEAQIDRKIRLLHAAGELEALHANLGFEQRLAAVYRDSKANGEAIMQHLEGKRGGGFHAPEMFGIITHPKLLAKVAALLGSGEIVASSVYRIRPKLPNIGRGIVPWHQDSGYLTEACDRHLIITCWVPLVDATVENGCMQILPRVHRGAIVRHHTGGNAGFLVIRDEDLPADPRTAVPAVCPKGGVVFMSNLAPHCSTPNLSGHIRWSVDLRYQSAEVPNNVGVWPGPLDDQGHASPEFYQAVNVACYPPEADFIVRSEKNPRAVSTYADYALRREAYEQTVPLSGNLRFWPQSSPGTTAR
jgi:ectoine hydroxylase-related dioxygenase (phytanoyl-CoA dioxygenase family)